VIASNQAGLQGRELIVDLRQVDYTVVSVLRSPAGAGGSQIIPYL